MKLLEHSEMLPDVGVVDNVSTTDPSSLLLAFDAEV